MLFGIKWQLFWTLAKRNEIPNKCSEQAVTPFSFFETSLRLLFPSCHLFSNRVRGTNSDSFLTKICLMRLTS